MTGAETAEIIRTLPLSVLFERYRYMSDFFTGIRLEQVDDSKTLPQYLATIPEAYLEDFGLSRAALMRQFENLICRVEEETQIRQEGVRSLTVIGGQDKSGRLENIRLDIAAGEVVGIVGPTGAGKSRLLGDIECLAQRDTPTRRQILLNGEVPDERRRFAVENKLVAQLSQNMNFVMDVTVAEFLRMHAESRSVREPENAVRDIFTCANELAGEAFDMETTVTQLSGGQSRALMIADTALLSSSPVVLIDEIENAGIDRRRAVELLAKKEKIVLMSTHDPLLALMADKRVVIHNGGISAVLQTDSKERANLPYIEGMDTQMTGLRETIRRGGHIDFDIGCYFDAGRP